MNSNSTSSEQLLLEDFFDYISLSQLESELKEMYTSAVKDNDQNVGFNLDNKAFMINKLVSLLSELNKNLN